MKEIKKFCGAKVGEMPKGLTECGMCDFWAKMIEEGKIPHRGEQWGCPAEMHVQLYSLKRSKNEKSKTQN